MLAEALLRLSPTRRLPLLGAREPSAHNITIASEGRRTAGATASPAPSAAGSAEVEDADHSSYDPPDGQLHDRTLSERETFTLLQAPFKAEPIAPDENAGKSATAKEHL